MFKKISSIVCFAIMLSLLPMTGTSQTGSGSTDSKTGETHTGVKRTYHKAKHKVKRAWKNTKAATSKEYNKVKTRVTTDDDKKDAVERK